MTGSCASQVGGSAGKPFSSSGLKKRMAISMPSASDPESRATGATSSSSSRIDTSSAARLLRPRQSLSRRLRIGRVVTQMTMANSRVPVNGSRTAMQPTSRSATRAIWMSCLWPGFIVDSDS
jgi:hypothetical protein